MTESLPRKLVAILYADVAGYSRLTGEDEDSTHRALSRYLDLISGIIDKNLGNIMHFAGDAVLAKFDAVVDALSSAMEIQSEINASNEKLPDERRVLFRIGVNLGDVIEDRGDIYGDGVNIAARLEGLAEPGGVCISDAVRTAVGKKFDVQYRFIGEQEVKNIAEPVRAYHVMLDNQTETEIKVFSDPGSGDRTSMAVLPFKDLSRDGSQAYLAVGLAEELVVTLGCIPWFFVSSPTSSLSLEVAQQPKAQIASVLGVNYLVDGSVQTSGDKVRITVRLTNAKDGQQIWAERFNGELDDLFDLQDHIARTVIAAIEPKMLQVEIQRSQAKHHNLNAFDYYLRALAHIRMMEHGDLAEALNMLSLAIESNPKYAAAHGLTAWLMTLYVPQGLEVDIESGLDHAQKAIEFGQGDPDALSTGGYALGYLNYDPLAGLTHVNESLGINPNSARAHDFAGWLLCYAGEAEQALAHFDESINLSRIDTFTFRALAGKAFALFFLDQVDEAVEFARRSLIANPNFTPCHRILAAALACTNRHAEARQIVDDLLQRVPGLTVKKFSRETRFIFPEYQRMLLDGLARAGLPGE